MLAGPSIGTPNNLDLYLSDSTISTAVFIVQNYAPQVIASNFVSHFLYPFIVDLSINTNKPVWLLLYFWLLVWFAYTKHVTITILSSGFSHVRR